MSEPKRLIPLTEAIRAFQSAVKDAQQDGQQSQLLHGDETEAALAGPVKSLGFDAYSSSRLFGRVEVETAIANELVMLGLSPDDAEKDADAAMSKIRQTDEKYNPPKGVGCSMSIYPWNISRMVFGRTVADNYLAVQVIVRNTDPDDEFLIHDAELAVDAYSGQLERFQASHEKEAVRGVVVYGQTYDRNAVWTHGVEAIGTILGAIVAVPGGGNDILTAASGAFSAGFLPSFQKLFPDLSTHNLNNVNDLAFSAAAASRIVVPKGGSVPFVIFVPVKPLEQACWLQKGYTPSADVGVATACSSIYTPDGTQIDSTNLKQPEKTDAEKNKYFSPGLYPDRHLSKYWPYVPQTVAFKRWNAEALTALQKHSYAVVAGSHIKELNAAPAVRSISCTSSTDDAVHIALLNGQSFTCTLTGADLDTVPTLRAESLANPSSKPIDATLTTSGDSTTAKATFAATTLGVFTDRSYELFAVDKTGTETDLNQHLAIMPLPTIDKATPFSPATVASVIKTQKPQLTIRGANLKQVTKVTLVPSNGSTISAPVEPGSTDSILNLDLASMPGAGSGPYNVMFILDSNGASLTYNPQVPFPE